MGTPIKKYLIWCDIERNVLKSFLHLFDTNYQNIRVQSNNVSTVNIDELVDEEAWKDLLREHFEVLDIFKENGREADYSNTDYYKREYANAPNGQQNNFTLRRIDELYSLYKSIRDNGYVKESKRLIKALWIKDLERKREVKYTQRITEKYYRLNGVRRLVICKYLGISEIPISLIKIKVVKL